MKQQTILPITLVVPVFREADAIATFLQKWVDLPVRPYRILLMDDSDDNTGAFIQAFAREHAWAEWHHAPQRLGLTASVLAGVGLTTSEWVAVMDADGQHPQAAWGLAAAYCREGTDLVLMSRQERWGRVIGMSWMRSAFSYGTRWAAWLIVPNTRRCHDPLSGFFFAKTSLAQQLAPTTGWKILLEILALTPWRQAVEVEYQFNPRVAGASKASVAIGMDYLRRLYYLRQHRVRHNPQSVQRVRDQV